MSFAPPDLVRSSRTPRVAGVASAARKANGGGASRIWGAVATSGAALPNSTRVVGHSPPRRYTCGGPSPAVHVLWGMPVSHDEAAGHRINLPQGRRLGCAVVWILSAKPRWGVPARSNAPRRGAREGRVPAPHDVEGHAGPNREEDRRERDPEEDPWALLHPDCLPGEALVLHHEARGVGGRGEHNHNSACRVVQHHLPRDGSERVKATAGGERLPVV
eukprot:scaffold16723_cov143-Isochrysis_galbana.AAC.10